MKLTKKLLAVLLATLLMVACLAACGADKNSKTKKDDDDEDTVTTTVADVNDGDEDTVTTTTTAPVKDDASSVAGNTYVFSDYKGYEEELMKSLLEGMYYTFDTNGTGTCGSSLSDEESTFNYIQHKDTVTLTDAGDGDFGQSEIFKVVGDTITMSEEADMDDDGTTETITIVLTKK